MSCVVPDCAKSPWRTDCRHISYHEFPNDLELRNEWIQRIFRGTHEPMKPKLAPKLTASHQVCSKHFLLKDYYPTLGIIQVIKLKPESVPSIFPWNSPAGDRPENPDGFTLPRGDDSDVHDDELTVSEALIPEVILEEPLANSSSCVNTFTGDEIQYFANGKQMAF